MSGQSISKINNGVIGRKRPPKILKSSGISVRFTAESGHQANISLDGCERPGHGSPLRLISDRAYLQGKRMGEN